jgi:ribosome modulation factor
LIVEAKQLAGLGSLIPAELRYRDQLQRFKSECAKAGIHGVHGLRHQYAQTRYQQLAGWKSPAAGGPTSKQLTPEQKRIDQAARQAISIEMGHHRSQITAIYLGR